MPRASPALKSIDACPFAPELLDGALSEFEAIGSRTLAELVRGEAAVRRVPLVERIPRRRHLTEREAELARRVASGKTNAEIASLLGLSPKTVGHHLSNILSKCGVRSRVDVATLCKGQKTTAKSATVTDTLSSKGGSFCIPAFGGFGGTIFSPSASPSIKPKVTSSTTNYNKKMPPLGTGTALSYLQLSTSGAVQFGTKSPAGGGLTSKSIKAGQTYTAFGQASAFGLTQKFTPCYTVAGKGSGGGSIGGIGSLPKKQDVPVPAKGFIEIYPGKQASAKC